MNETARQLYMALVKLMDSVSDIEIEEEADIYEALVQAQSALDFADMDD